MEYYFQQFYPAGMRGIFRQEADIGLPGQYSMGPLPSVGKGYRDIFAEERQTFEDVRKLQSYYPRIAQEIQRHVEEECDKMEYEGSMMFDEYPDPIMFRQIAQRIYEKVKDLEPEAADMQKGEELEMQSDRRRRRPDRDNWLGDLVQVLLVDEMHRRRCRHRRCRRFW